MAVAITDAAPELKRLYSPGRDPELVHVPELSFLMIDGHGDPNVSPRYQLAIQALYGVSYTLKFGLKRAGGPDFKVGALEGLWWVEGAAAFSMEDKSAWDWTAMIRQPDQVTPRMVEQAAADVANKKQLPAARELRLERFAEGECAQVMHVGPYAEEGPTIRRLHAFIDEQGCVKRGKHHEIYLSDPRRTPADRLKTIVRQPVSRP